MEKVTPQPLKLRDDVAKAYDVKPGKVRKFYSAQFGHVDLNTITLASAEKLANAGILVRKSEAKKPS